MILEILTDLERQFNADLHDIMAYSNLYVKGLFNQGIIKTVEMEKLIEMFSNPDMYQYEINRIAEFYYVINAEIHQLFEILESLNDLNYRIETDEFTSTAHDTIKNLNKNLRKLKHKRLTRDLLKQLASSGNVVGMWVGGKNKLTPLVFDDLRMVEVLGRNLEDEWICALSLDFLNQFPMPQRKIWFDDLKKYLPNLKDIDNNGTITTVDGTDMLLMPPSRTFSLITGRLKRNQVSGTNWITSVMGDVLHKKKLKDAEQAVANKIINAVAVLKLGSGQADDLEWRKISKKLRTDIHENVKKALGQGKKEGMALVTIPDFTDLKFPEIKADGLGGDKYNQSNSDISKGIGLGSAPMNGEGSNYNTAKLNLEVFMKRIAVMLEDIETDVYQKFFNLQLKKAEADSFYMTYDKELPLTKKEKLEALKYLQSQGWSSRYFVELLGYNFDSLLESTLYETEELKLQDVIRPYLTSNVISKNDQGVSGNVGRNKLEESEITNENTQRAKQNY